MSVVRPEAYRNNSLHAEPLKHDPRHALSVGLGVQKSFREPDGMLLGRNP